ncbi:MAG: hypothetical protein IJX54_01875 [Oscillospiraceae bacterium]|nr:hypothetical protein [Oscillospiraceae bacterium]
MKNQYKIEVDQISLSESFKQSLKEKMAAEYAAEAANTLKTKKSFNFSKYSKYIATAACLVLIAATVSVVSALNGGFAVEKSADSLFRAEDLAPESNNMGADTESIDSDGLTYGLEEDDDAPVEDTVESEDEAIVVEEPVEDIVVEDALPSVEESESAVTEAENEEVVEEAVLTEEEEVLKSAFAPENYDGEYFAEDYILSTSAANNENISTVENIVDVLGNKEITYSELCSEIDDMDEVGFAKFRIVEVLSEEDANAVAENDSFADENTMYRAELIYDYLNNTSVDGELYVTAYGNSSIQQEGFPAFAEGDVILAGIDNSDGYSSLLEEMVYMVYRVNGVDIAYHLVYENMDPGDTNMGILDMETEMVTTTENNPAKFTHKAAVKELTRYVRRNFEKREFTFADLVNVIVNESENEETTLPEETVVSGEVSVNVSAIKLMIGSKSINPAGSGSQIRDFANYVTATETGEDSCTVKFGQNAVTFEGTSPYVGNIRSIEINSIGSGNMMFTINSSIGIGSSWQHVVSSLGLEIEPAENAVVDVAVMSGDWVSYTMTVTVENGVVTQILFS